MAQAEQHSITTSDHLLLALCQRADLLGKAIDGINSFELDEDRADEQAGPLYEELGTIQLAIVNMRAHTLDKAHSVAWCRVGDLSTEMDDPGMDFEMMMSMVRDLLSIEVRP